VSAVAVAGAAAVAATAVLPGSAAPAAQHARDTAFAATPHADGTVTLAVYDKPGYAGINARLRKLGDSRVVVVPAEAGCPTSLGSLPAPKVKGHGWSLVRADLKTGTVTVQADGIPKGDILVVAVDVVRLSTSDGAGLVGWSTRLTSPPAPSCASLPLPTPPGGWGVRYSGGGPGTQTGSAPARPVQSG
jgi:hypothetical protein